MRMHARDVLRASAGGYLAMLKVPLDCAAWLVRENGQPVGPADIAVDRFDATLHLLAGALLRDSALLEEADQRRTAADERDASMRSAGARDQQAPNEPVRAKAEPPDLSRTDRAQEAVRRAGAATHLRASRYEATGHGPRVDSLQDELDELEEEQDAQLATDEMHRLKDSAISKNSRRYT